MKLNLTQKAVPKKMKVLALSFLAVATLHASDMQFGKGNFQIKGGFFGLDQELKLDITTYSLVEQHKNIFSSKWYYNYNFTWYDSKQATQAQKSVNSFALTYNLPSIDYRIQGLDVNLGIGRDILHKDENNYLGMGLLVGLSTPWIDSKKSSSNNDNTTSTIFKTMKQSKTKIFTYKIGPAIAGRYSLNKYFSVYGSGTIAYQKGTFKNSYANSDLNVNGIFQEYDAGLRFQPFAKDYKLGWLTISPRLYATMGYRYSSWKLNDVNVDIMGTNLNFNVADFEMKSSVGYFGLGYSF